MAILKCKMCGGELNITEGKTVAECEYCGSVQTVPTADNEKKLTLFARANRLRAGCEFDKAAGVYETIVADFPEEAEAYWGLVLCKYGIEYVDDPATGRKIPTCHRSSFNSVLEDSDFEQALENADVIARKVYREEAKQIEEIRKGIIAVSANEQPYDIFICYKETAENGERTLDSVLAQDIYDALTDKGYRVFFSRITLEDKLGMEYEPYIFAALNSAKVMLAVGTDYEYYNAVWVKNEWSRYLKLMEQDKSKHLIPCFKGIDAYDMPREFARLQAQDMGKLGAMQDLLRGIEKILPREQPVTVVQEKVVVGGSGNNKIASLLDRGNMALEDGDWDKADSFFEDVLNNDSKNAQAYLGKTLAQEKCRTIDAFVRKRKDMSQNVRGETLQLKSDEKHIDAAVEKFSLPGYVPEESIRGLYRFDLSYHSDVAERQRQYHSEEKYWSEHKQLSRAEKFATGAVAEHLAQEKKALLAALAERVKKAQTEEAAEIKKVQEAYTQHLNRADAQANALYQQGVEQKKTDYQQLLQIARTSNDVKELTKTAKKFEAFGDYQDSRNLAAHCRKRSAEEQAKLDAEAERQRRLREREAARISRRNKKIAIITAMMAVLAIATALIVTKVVIPTVKYNDAVALMDAGQYEEAIVAFGAMDGYKDSAEQIAACETAILDDKYNDAVALMDAGQYDEAIAAFEAMDGYKDSAEQIAACETAILDEKYSDAVALMDVGQYDEAIAAFEAMDGYKDSANKIEVCNINIYGEEVWNKIKNTKAGDYISFGRYEQDNDTSNGKENIEWLVLDKQDEKILVISKYALDCKPYNTERTDVTWETCSLRKWLNSDFVNTAFSAGEKAMIPTVTISADKDLEYSADPGNATEDQVFLLSSTEARKYLDFYSTRQCVPTDYAVANGTYVYDGDFRGNGNCWWWLRSPGRYQDCAAHVSYNGDFSIDSYVNNSYGAVRPALWIDLSK